MKTCRVDIPPYVQEQIRAQLVYIAQDSVDNALAWDDRLQAAIKRIGQNPGAYSIDETATAQAGQPIRRMVFERTYLVFFRVPPSKDVVEIVTFRHGARRPRGREF